MNKKQKQIEESIKIIICLTTGAAIGLMLYVGLILAYPN